MALGVAMGVVDPRARNPIDPTPSERGSPPAAGELDDLRTQNAELTAEVSSLEGEVSRLGELLNKETERVSEMWRMSCAPVAGFDKAITTKDTEIESLRARISELEASVGRRYGSCLSTCCSAYSTPSRACS